MIIIPREPAPEVSKYAKRIVAFFGQTSTPFENSDAGISHNSRWQIAQMIDGVIKQAIEEFVEWSEQPEGDNGNGTEDTTVGH